MARAKSKCAVIMVTNDMFADSEGLVRDVVREFALCISVPLIVVRLGGTSRGPSCSDDDLHKLLLAHNSIDFSEIDAEESFGSLVHQLARMIEKETRKQAFIKDVLPLIPRSPVAIRSPLRPSEEKKLCRFESFSFVRKARMRIMDRILRVKNHSRCGAMHLKPGDLCTFIGFEQDAVALEAYNPSASNVRDQLPLIKGERINLLHKIPLEADGCSWYEGRNKKGRKGLVPTNHLQILSSGKRIWVLDSFHQVGLFDSENFENSLEHFEFKSEIDSENENPAKSFQELAQKYGEFFKSLLQRALNFEVFDSASCNMLKITEECKLDDFQELMQEMESTNIMSIKEKQDIVDEARKCLLAWYERVILDIIERIRLKRSCIDYDAKRLKCLDVVAKDVYLNGKQFLIDLSVSVENDHLVYERVCLVDLIQSVREALHVEEAFDLQDARDGEYLDSEEDWQCLFDKLVSDWHGANDYNGTLVLYAVTKQQRASHVSSMNWQVNTDGRGGDHVDLVCSTVMLERTLPLVTRRDVDVEALATAVVNAHKHTVELKGLSSAMPWSLVRQHLCDTFGCCVLLEYTPFDLSGRLEKKAKGGEVKGRERMLVKSSKGFKSKHSSTKTIRSEADWREVIARVLVDCETYNVLNRKIYVDLHVDAVQDLKPMIRRSGTGGMSKAVRG
eukprot:760492-Hanusia_phi.AAC.3